MREEHRLHLGAGDVVAGRNDHVVVARDEMKISLLVLAKCIASQVPAVLHILTLTDVGDSGNRSGPAPRTAQPFREHCYIEQVEAAPPARSEELAYWNHQRGVVISKNRFP